jgi:hypothetical protein
MTAPTLGSPQRSAELLPAPASPHPIRATWLGCDLVSGQIVAELPSLAPQSSIGRRLGNYASATFDVEITPSLDLDWIGATQPGRALLVCVVADQPIWSGIIVGPRRGGSATTVTLTAVTPECYLDRRYVGTHTWQDVDEASDIAAGLLADAASNGIGLVVDAPSDGTLASATYSDTDDTTIWSALSTLMGYGSPEVTIDTAWSSSAQTAVQLIARVRRRIGVQATAPNVVFDLPGCVTGYVLTESYEDGKGATCARAAGLGEGSSRASSGDVLAATYLAGGWPRYDYRWTPSDAITDTALLRGHAQQALSLMEGGSHVWEITASAAHAPVPGVDFGLGDSVRVAVASSPRHPAGVSAVSRVWGWDLDIRGDVLTPILADDTEGGY